MAGQANKTAMATPAARSSNHSSWDTLTTLHQFQFTDGGYPEAGLLQTINGNFYGTTAVGGSSGAGTIFRITPAGRLTTVYEFQIPLTGPAL